MNTTLELIKILSPEIILFLSGFLILGLSLFPSRADKAKTITIIAAVIAAGALVWMISGGGIVSHPSGLYQMIPLLAVIKIIFVFMNLFFVFSADREDYGESRPEFFALMQFATAGFMLLISSTSLITIFLSLEFASICLYALTALRANRKQVIEAAFKYFTFGATASAFLVFGMSLLYGLSGEVELAAIRTALSGTTPDSMILGIAIIFILVGFGFKLAVAPFHFWAPDIYQKAPLPVAGLLASVSNYAAFLALARILYVALEKFPGKAFVSADAIRLLPGWGLVLCLFTLASLFVGNFGALNQSNLRRLLAYSAVAQSAFVLLALVAFGVHGLTAVFDYNLAYSLATAGIFLAIKYARAGEAIGSLGQLRARSIPLAICLSIFLLSLAGVPPCVGFVAKFYVFVSAFLSPLYSTAGLMWLVILALGASVLGFFYYLRVVKVLWVSEVTASAERIPLRQIAPVLLLGALVILLGLLPQFWLHFVHESLMLFLG